MRGSDACRFGRSNRCGFDIRDDASGVIVVIVGIICFIAGGDGMPRRRDASFLILPHKINMAGEWS
jgi:hypothetical protein